MRKVGHLSCVRDEKGLKRKCDYLLFVEDGDEDYVVLIELKPVADDVGAREQLFRTRPIVDYLVAGARLQGHPDRPLSVRNIVIAERSGKKFAKQGVRLQAQTPVGMWSYATIQGCSFVAVELSMVSLLKDWGRDRE